MKPLRALPSSPPTNQLGSTTWEQRRGMSAAQLITLMGPAWAGHPDFTPKPRSLLPMPNLAGRQPMIEEHHMSFWRFLRQMIHFMMI
jgi:hypothetical protein